MTVTQKDLANSKLVIQDLVKLDGGQDNGCCSSNERGVKPLFPIKQNIIMP
jgi:hypothetical protein